MPSHRWFTVKVVLKAGNREIESPQFTTEDEAQAALAAIRHAVQSGDWPELDWLAVNGVDILAAHVQSHSAGVFAA